MKSTAIYYHPAFMLHDTGTHPENSTRLVSIIDALKKAEFADSLAWPSFAPATNDDLTLIHTAQHLKHIEQTCSSGGGNLDMDTVACPDSWNAALLAVGATCSAAEAVMKGEYKTAFCVVRPPGHHAEAQRAMGFCLFNNVAIAARKAVRSMGAERVAIFDFDVHHGNGSQSAFYEDPSVFYLSMHQAGHYPGTGWAEDIGDGKGEGTTLNIPLGSMCGDDIYMENIEGAILPALEKYQPQLIFLSAGFDAHKSDPLAGMMVSSHGFYRITKAVVELADRVCQGRVVSALEGGYDQTALAESAPEHVKALLGL